MNSLVKIVCPLCRGDLAPQGSMISCDSCNKSYKEWEGILSFVEPDESFNPTRFKDKQECEWSASAQFRENIRQSKILSAINRIRIRTSMSGRRDRVFLREMLDGDRNKLILDIGCGGGRHYFAEYGQVIGIDPVIDLLHIAKRIYREVYQASATALPFADSSFDYVVSTDVIGHIPVALKDQVFAEIFRVLRPGGRTVHCIETDATNPWFRFAHKYPALFNEIFVELPGHISLERPTQLRERFLKHGFREVTFRRIAGVIQDCGFFAGSFANEYASKNALVAPVVALDRLLSKNLLVKEVCNVLLEPLAQIEDRLSPLDYTNGSLVVYEKPRPT